MTTSHKIVLFLATCSTVLGSLLIYEQTRVGKLRLIFCDVGQGDGMLIMSPTGKQIVVDGGPGSRMDDCISEKIPYWDRTLDMVVMTHPQKDHMEGLIDVLARYEVKTIATNGIKADSELYAVWKEAEGREGAKMYTPKNGDNVMLDKESSLTVLWPDSTSLESWKKEPPKDLNDSSIVMRLDYGHFCAYLTGDIPKEILEKVAAKKCQLLKIAHHGSKTGTNEQILKQVRPLVAVIQVGKNSYGHPYPAVIQMLNNQGVKILRNDLEGTIELIGDQRGLSLKR